MIAMSRFHALAALFLPAVVASIPLAAQPGEGQDPHLRNDCRLAAQVIRTGHPAPSRDWAFDTIRRCDASGPRVLADLWLAATPAEQGELERLFNVTRDFNDRQLLDAVIDVARRSGAPETTRVYAFALLYSYAVPGLYLEIGDLLDPRGTPPGVFAVSHDTPAHETHAVLGDLRPEVAAILNEVATSDPSTRIRQAATTVSRRLRAP
jgi:hypothetical protein